MRCNGEANGRRERAEGVECSRVSRQLSGPPKQPSQPQRHSGGSTERLSINLVGETGDVVELLEKLCSHRMFKEVGWRSDLDPLPGKPLQHLHRQGITEPPIQFIPLIQQRPVVATYISSLY